jgi:hypothetical protein
MLQAVRDSRLDPDHGVKPATSAAASRRCKALLSSSQKKAARLVAAWDPSGRVKAREFLLSYERALDSEDCTEEQKLHNIGLHLQGAASNWYYGVTKAQDPALSTWARFKTLLRCTFDPPPSLSTAVATLFSCRIKPAETVRTHLLRYTDCAMDLDGHYTPFQLRSIYLDAIRPATAEALRQSYASELNDATGTWTYAQVAAAALEYEERQDRLRAQQNVWTAGGVTQQTETESRKRRLGQLGLSTAATSPSTMTSTSSPSSQSPVPPLETQPGRPNPAVQRGGFAYITCWQCGNKGHYAQNCVLPRAEFVPGRPTGRDRREDSETQALPPRPVPG